MLDTDHCPINDNNILHCDLLVSSFISALCSYRKDSVLNPFPKDYLFANGHKDYKRLECIAKQIPHLKELIKNGTTGLDKTTQNLLNWVLDVSTVVITQCKSNEMDEIKKLTKQTAKAPEPNFIFKVNYKNEIFNELPLKKYFAYHGSSLENLYSLLSNGLQPEFSKNGLFGDGIYLSSELSMSLNYSRRGKSWSNSILGKYMSFAIVCELIDDGSSQLKYSDGKGTPDTYFIVRNAELAKIRYLLVYTYPDGISSGQTSTVLPSHDRAGSRLGSFQRWWNRNNNSWLLVLVLYALFLLALATINSNSLRSLISKTLPFKRKTFPPDIY